ncbi:MAG: DUF1778 domain-containing protein [Puia sp.]|nr:DUF1778 domain-containing protein [Puia sp.]
MKTKATARFDTRIPEEQKQFFEYAANLGGFRTLTEFVIHSVRLQAEKIIEKHNAILASKKDQELFFTSLMNPPKPNDKLKEAAKRYRESFTK